MLPGASIVAVHQAMSMHHDGTSRVALALCTALHSHPKLEPEVKPQPTGHNPQPSPFTFELSP